MIPPEVYSFVLQAEYTACNLGLAPGKDFPSLLLYAAARWGKVTFCVCESGPFVSDCRVHGNHKELTAREACDCPACCVFHVWFHLHRHYIRRRRALIPTLWESDVGICWLKAGVESFTARCFVPSPRSDTQRHRRQRQRKFNTTEQLFCQSREEEALFIAPPNKLTLFKCRSKVCQK